MPYLTIIILYCRRDFKILALPAILPMFCKQLVNERIHFYKQNMYSNDSNLISYKCAIESKKNSHILNIESIM